MLEILKKIGLHATTAAVVVVLITGLPIYYQWHYTKEQNARIEALEAKVKALEAAK